MGGVCLTCCSGRPPWRTSCHDSKCSVAAATGISGGRDRLNEDLYTSIASITNSVKAQTIQYYKLRPSSFIFYLLYPYVSFFYNLVKRTSARCENVGLSFN